MHRGYTKRWRKRWDSGYQQDPLLWVMMDYFIDFATYRDKEVFKKDVGKIKLLRGEWHFTYRELAKFMSVNPRRIRTCISTLSKIGFLTLKPTHQYTIASVNKYDTYQPLEILRDTANDTDPTQHRHSIDTPLIKDTKKVKKVNNTKARAWPGDFSLTDDKKRYAVEGGIHPEKVELFWADFKDWAQAKGATYKDWNAAFRMRVRKAPDFGKQFLGGNGNRAPFDMEKEKQRISTDLAAKRLEKFKRAL